MKKAVSLLLAALLLTFSFLPSLSLHGLAESAAPIVFTCGDTVTGTFDPAARTLTVSGTGAMDFNDDRERPPWFAYRNDISYVVIEEGVTQIQTNAFLSITMERITIPASVERIGEGALSMGDVKEIVIAEDSRLCDFLLDSSFRNTTWYKQQPDGPVYLGRMLLDYKGSMPENCTLTLRDGTYAVNTQALYNQTNLADVVAPDSLRRVGRQAFFGTAWLNAVPYREQVYLGPVLVTLRFPWRTAGEADMVESGAVKAGTLAIADYAFENSCIYRSLTLPASLEYIGEGAFQNSYYLEQVHFAQGAALTVIGSGAFYSCWALQPITFPESLREIGTEAFGDCRALTGMHLPAHVERLGTLFCENHALSTFTISPENTAFSLDENGVLYNYDRTVVVACPASKGKTAITLPETVTHINTFALSYTDTAHWILPASLREIGDYAFSNAEMTAITLPYGVKRIGNRAFHYCQALTAVELPKSLEYIGASAFYANHALETVLIPAEVSYINESAFGNINTTFYVYLNSPGYYYVTENNLRFVLLEAPDTAQLDALLETSRTLPRAQYLAQSLAALDAAVAAVDPTITLITQEMVDDWAAQIAAALDALEYQPADYYAVEIAVARADALDRSLYTAESLANLDAAIDAVDETLDITRQEQVRAFAAAIIAAIDALEYLPADYTAVDAAKAEAHAIDRLLYSQATLTALDQSIAAATPGLDITQQATVDGFAAAIRQALDGLAYADVTLRNDLHGVLVSGTAREIYPTTALSVDRLDPSQLEGANFAVGGHIKSVQYFDIRLLRGGAVVQPNGQVTVKIRIPDGVAPEKCRVYHVTEDPVDPLVRFASALDGNYILFNTDHFSEFAVIEVETVLESIAITTPPAKTVYTLGEPVDPAGMVVTAVFSDGTAKPVTDYDLSADTTVLGTRQLTVYYTFNGKTCAATTTITVTAPQSGLSLRILKPSVQKISYGDTLILHANGNLPAGTSVVWKCAGRGVKLTPAADGRSCAVKCTGSGEVTVTATAVDRAGMPIVSTGGQTVSDAVTLTADGGFIARLRSFFRDLFRFNRVIDE